VPRIGAVLAVALVLALLIDIRLEVGKSPAVPTVRATPAAARPPSAPPTRTPAPADVLGEMNLQVPGSRVHRLPGEISVTFTRGLFSNGATLSAHGRSVLAALGARLRPYGMRIAVAVVGYTDSLPVLPGSDFANNMELGTLRATVAREVLHAVAGIPTVMFTVSSMGGATPLFRGDDTAARARNRTVSLRISAVGEG
jgi:type VI secretion system protein ImpK